MELKEFFIEYLGFIPFKINGNISINEKECIVELHESKNSSFEEFLKRLLIRITKKNVSIKQIGNNSLQFLVTNWNNLITGTQLERFLRLILPEVENEDTLILRTHSLLIKSKLNMNKSVFEYFLLKYTGKKINYKIIIDEKLNPEIEAYSQSYYDNQAEYIEQLSTNPVKQTNSSLNNDNIVIGKNFKKIPIPLKSIPLSENTIIVVKGTVFHKEYNDKNKIVSIFITDKTDSIIIKAFKEKAEKIFNSINEGDTIKVEGSIFYDTYINDFAVIPFNLIKEKNIVEREDTYKEKRVELHMHSRLSTMDGILSIKEIVKQSAKWGHKAIAITDHGIVQSIPVFYDEAKKANIKPIFGTEAYVVDESVNIITLNSEDRLLDETNYVVFDFETTGLQPAVNEIIEIGAVKIKNGEVSETYHELIKPTVKLPEIITKITNITDEMLENQKGIEEVLPSFLEFIDGTVLVAHNADFDYRFLREWVNKLYNKRFKMTYIDTLSMSKSLLNLSGYALNKVVKALKLDNFNHHRADEDARITALVFLELLKKAKNRGLERLSELDNLKKLIDYKSLRPVHMTILVKNKVGLKNLYKLISNAHLKYFYRVPRILKSELNTLREGLLIGSGCQEGELSEAFLRSATKDELVEIAKFYDFIEIMPIDTLETKDPLADDLKKEMYKTFYNISKELNLPSVMTGNVHYMNKEDIKFRHALKVADKKRPMVSNRYFRTTNEMIDEALKIFEDKDIAEEVVIKNTNKIADLIEEIQPLRKVLTPPKIEGAEDMVRNLSMDTAHKIYGDPLPQIIIDRLNFELDAIINNGYSVLYLMAQKIVKKSNDDGYLVGSRGSVGSSLVATMMGITEVNPLIPHYVCPECKYSEFITDDSYSSGYDLPDKKCPKCGTNLKKNGQSIPFATFMGFEGDKVPDIDLNFSGEYQTTAHKYVEEMFGVGHVFKAGTISTVAERTAYGYAKAFKEDMDKYNLDKFYGDVRSAELQRIASHITGVKRTTGQHPGGLMIVPKEYEVYDFTPIQRPANDQKSTVTTTHFDYHVIHDDLIKLDALGHDDPTFIRMLQDLTGIDPLDVPLDDKETLSLFSGYSALKADLKKELDSNVGSFGIPEFGTPFVRRMLEDTMPKTFAELVRISGLSHGTDVWLGNAQTLIKEGKATLKDVISCRDDIMNYLIQKGNDPKKSFFIMEKVRKGKGLTAEEEKQMREVKVPEWFITSCKKIKYLFPKAHATAYVSMAVRIAWFKVHKPLAFYATYFSVKGDEFNLSVIIKGKNAIKKRLMELKTMELDVKKKSEKTVLEIALEMLLRNFEFKNVDLNKSDSKKFLIVDNGLLIPFLKIPQLGEKAAKSIIVERQKKPFNSIQNLLSRTGLNKTNIETLKELGILKGLPETNQMSLFGG